MEPIPTAPPVKEDPPGPSALELERVAMQAIFKETNLPEQKRLYSPHCPTELEKGWIGVTCNANGFVTKIHLSKGDLTNMYYSYLGKKLPSEIGYLTNLEVLYISFSDLEELPTSIGKLKKLIALGLIGNKLTSVPEEIGQLERLQVLRIYSTNLEKLPKTIGQLKDVYILELFSNQLKEIPSEIGKLVGLQILNLKDNKLEQFPVEIGLIHELTDLNLSFNKISEKVPTPYEKLEKLKIFDVSENKMLDTTLPLPLQSRVGSSLTYIASPQRP